MDDTPTPEDEEAGAEPAPEHRDSLEAVRERLATRGLLRAAPIPAGPRTGLHLAAPRLPSLFSEAATEEPAAPPEAWDLESQGGQPVELSCPRCIRSRLWPADVTRFRCDDCQRAWRWAACDACGALGLAQERLESWQCRGCGGYTRSWWRTPSATRDARTVVARLRQVALDRQRAVALAAARRRRRRLGVASLVVVVAVAVALAAAHLGRPSQAGGTSVACSHFVRLRSGLANGSVSAARLPAELAALAREAAGADPAVEAAAAGLAGAGDPAKAPFLVASTRLADACAAAGA